MEYLQSPDAVELELQADMNCHVGIEPETCRTASALICSYLPSHLPSPQD